MPIVETYRRLALPVYLPSLLLAVVHAAVPVLLPLYVLELGYGAVAASVVFGFRGIGMLLFDLPAGALAVRLGDKPVMLITLSMMLIGIGMLIWSTPLWLLCAVTLIYGAGMSGWMLARQSYITDTAPLNERGRAIAILAGIQRIGVLLGPLAGGFIAGYFGFRTVFAVIALATLLGLGLVALYARNAVSEYLHEPHWARFRGMAYQYRGVLATAGLAGVTLMLMRSARSLLIPLIGESMGLDVATIGVIYSIGAALDLALFYPAGQIMDRYGRKWTAVPGMTVLAAGFALLLLVEGPYSLLAVTCLIGMGNGMTTGIFLTLGSDFAPSTRRGEFLGIWRLMGDAGHTAAPFLVGSLVKLASLSASLLAVSLLGLSGAAIMLFLVRETLRK